jgi:Tol biopolymer transport system component
LWTVNLSTSQGEQLTRDDQFRVDPAWSHDGSRLAYMWRRATQQGEQDEVALAIWRTDINAEELISTPRIDSMVDPSDWAPDGQRVLASWVGPSGQASLGLWPVSAAPHAETAVKMLAEIANYALYEGKYSPDGRWIAFNAINLREPGSSTIFVMPSQGGDRSSWVALTGPRDWTDKPRWSPDGSLVYFIKQSAFFNVWAARFDGVAGKPVGQPFQVTRFDSPRRHLSSNFVAGGAIGVSAHRLVLTIMEQTGNIWMLDGVE